jgi:hypothetical protein
VCEQFKLKICFSKKTEKQKATEIKNHEHCVNKEEMTNRF